MPRRTSDISRMGSSPGLLVSDWIIRNILGQNILTSFQPSWDTEEPDGRSPRRNISRRSRGSRWPRGSRRSMRMRSRSGSENVTSAGHKISVIRPVICSGPTLKTRKWSARSNKGRLHNIKTGMLKAPIFWRYKDNKEGRMNSLLFVYIENEIEKLSGHVDLTARWGQIK